MSWWPSNSEDDWIGDIPADLLIDMLKYIANIAQEQGKDQLTLESFLDTIIAIIQLQPEKFLEEGKVRIQRIIAKQSGQPDVVVTGSSPQSSEIIIRRFRENLEFITELYLETFNRKPRLSELLANIEFVSPGFNSYFSLESENRVKFVAEIVAIEATDSADEKTSPPLVTIENYSQAYRRIPLSTDTYGLLILLNVSVEVSKGDANLDFNFCDIEDGFLGFKLVPPGAHHFSLGVTGKIANCWCYLQPKQVLVKELYFSRRGKWIFQEPLSETIAHYQNLAAGGRLDKILQPYLTFAQGEMPWQQITQHITQENLTTLVELEKSGKLLEDVITWQQQLNFEQALEQTHGGDALAFLAEFEFVYLVWREEYKKELINRWHQLLQVISLADIHDYTKSRVLFIDIVDILLTQFRFAGSRIFDSNKSILDLAGKLSTSMIASGIEEVVQKGQELAAYLTEEGFISN